MAILETFYILFKSDASDVKKGADDAEKSTKHLEQSLKNVGKETEHIGAGFAAAARSVVGLFAGIASINGIISGFHAAVNEVTEVGNLSRELNVNVEALDAWGHAIQRTGGTAAGFQSSLKSLSEHFGTTPAIALQLLPRLASAFSRMNQFQANQYGKSLGLDQSTIYLLQQGRREVEATIKQQKELGLVTQHQVEVTQKFDNALYNAGRAYNTFYRELAEPLLPGFTKAINYLIEHKNAVIGAFTGIGAAGVLLAAPFVAANASVVGLTLAIGGLIAAFALVFDDIKTFNEGGKSVTSTIVSIEESLSNKFKKWGDNLPQWLQVLTGHNALKSGSTTTASNLTNPFSGITLPSLATLTGHNALRANNTVTIGDVTINTQATDGSEIAKSFVPSLKDQLSQANSFFDNGVHA